MLNRDKAYQRSSAGSTSPSVQNVGTQGKLASRPGPQQVSNLPDMVTSASITPSPFWSAVASSQAFATQLLSHFSRLQGQVLAERVLQEASRKEREKQLSSILPDISPFLHAVPIWEMKHIRRLSHLSALTYQADKVNEKTLKKCHNLSFITSSWSQAMQSIDSGGTEIETPTEESNSKVVATKLAEAAKAASAAAVPLLESAAGSIAAGFASLPLRNPLSGTGGSNSSSSNMDSNSSAEGSIFQLSSNPTSTLLSDPTQLSLAPSTRTLAISTPPLISQACPSEWFICDDAAHQLRLFVIQGSDTIDHWKLNLTFDPVTFEDPNLGVTVHRGVYEAALILYDRFLPYVCEHLESSPLAKITFTGHSIGGSLATLLMLMYKKRGVLTNQSIATVYTFGAPSVFCEEHLSHWSLSSVGSGDSTDMQDLFSDTALSQEQGLESKVGPSGLLAALDLRDQIVRNIIMHRDIVPRAFACDYSLVSDILKGIGNGFRDHHGLSGDGRKHLYYFVGRMIVLQPDKWNSFVGNDPDHPLLPPGPGLHYLAEPNDMLVPPPFSVEDVLGHGLSNSADFRKELELLNTYSFNVPSTARAAVMELMDNPHPLETLADPAAYLATGSISRYHNPDHYTVAFGRILHLRRQTEDEPVSGYCWTGEGFQWSGTSNEAEDSEWCVLDEERPFYLAPLCVESSHS